jgi:tetratricopeptide (TPR) repeat protein
MLCMLSRRLLLTPAVISLVCVLSPSSGAQEELASQVQQHFRAAQQDQQAGLLDDAAHEYQTILRLQPGLAEVYANLGLVYYAQAKFDDSAYALAAADKLKPRLRGVALWLGIDYVKLNRPVQGAALLREAIRADPTDKLAQSWLGTALWNAGQPVAALDQLAKANALFPSDVDIHFVLGEAYRKAADEEVEKVLAATSGQPLLNQVYGDIYKDEKAWSKAEAHYRLALEKDPKWKGSHLGLGEVSLYQYKMDDAQKQLLQELDVDPRSAAAYANLAEVALLKGDTHGAISMLDDALRISPDAPSSALGLPSSYTVPRLPLSEDYTDRLRKVHAGLQQIPLSSSRNLALAIVDRWLDLPDFDNDWKSYQASLRDTPQSGSPYSRALVEFDRQQFGEAEASLRLWLESHPKDLNARYLLAQTLRDLSLQVSSELLEMAPTSPRAHQLQAEAYENREEDDKALAEYRIVEQTDPSLSGIHFEIGHLLWKSGDPQHALEELNKELQLDPEHPEANGEIGTILVTQHQPDQAIPYLETALRAKPDLWLIHQQLGKAYLLQKDYPKAEAELKKALPNDLNGTAHYQLGLVYRVEGKEEAAGDEFEAARRIKAERLDEATATSSGVPPSE